MKKIFITAWILLIPFTVFGQEKNLESIITAYKNGNYYEAVKLLRDVEQKNARIYYYMGLTNYKLGREERAKKNFLAAYYISPASRWGKAAYKNYRYMTKKLFHYDIIPTISYDSNVNYTPDVIESTTGAALLELYLTGKLNLTRYLNFRYSYSRNQYFKDIDNSDSHTVNMKLFKGPAELTLNSSYSNVGGSPFYIIYGAKAGLKNIELGGRKKEYLDEASSYLDGYSLTGKVSVDISKVRLSYGYEYNQARDLKEEFSYYKHTGSIDDREYDFKEQESDKEYFLSYTHRSHSLRVQRGFVVDDKATVRFSGEYEFKDYIGKNRWYRNYWIENSTDSYYWSDSEEKWIESSVRAPGEEQSKNREDHRIKGKISYNYDIDRDMTLTVTGEYAINRSNMDDIASFNYNWTKRKLGASLNYDF
ncbi:MAG: tetratricopeptide repeat protein [Elusimicrobiota bacterium]